VKALIRRRERIVRVRHVQHLQAAAQAAQAEGKVVSLESSAERLVELRSSLALPPGPVNGASLSNVGGIGDAARFRP